VKYNTLEYRQEEKMGCIKVLIDIIVGIIGLVIAVVAGLLALIGLIVGGVGGLLVVVLIAIVLAPVGLLLLLFL